MAIVYELWVLNSAYYPKKRKVRFMRTNYTYIALTHVPSTMYHLKAMGTGWG